MPFLLPLPPYAAVPVIRTDFTSPEGWERLLRALATPVGTRSVFQQSSDVMDDYDRAVHYVDELDHEQYRGMQADDVLAAAPTGHGLAYDHLYLADAVTFAGDDLPLLGIDIDPDEERAEPFRVPALHVASVEVNVDLANMWFSEFHGFEWDDDDLMVAGPGTAVWEAFEQMDQGS